MGPTILHQPPVFDGLSPVRGKCIFWRERLEEEDLFDGDVKPRNRRVHCVCFVEGDRWEATVSTVPDECPFGYRCRYHIRT